MHLLFNSTSGLRVGCLAELLLSFMQIGGGQRHEEMIKSRLEPSFPSFGEPLKPGSCCFLEGRGERWAAQYLSGTSTGLELFKGRLQLHICYCSSPLP